MEALLLGTGDAFGIPRPGCGCAQCEEARSDAACARLRSGVLLRTPAQQVLLDCSPDILRQLDRVGVEPSAIDCVILSHHHNDHCFGLYDLARTRRAELPALRVHAGAATQAVLRAAMPSLVRDLRPLVALEPWAAGQRLEFDGLAVEGFETHHIPDGETTAMIVEIERGGVTRRVAYATDMGERLPPRVTDVDVFAGDATYLGGGGKGHPGTTRVIELARAAGARRVALTHVGHWGVRAADGAAAVGADVAICRDGDDLFSFLA